MPGRPPTGRAIWASVFGRHRSPVRIVSQRDALLRRVIAHASEHVPYYRALFDQHGIRPGTIRTGTDLHRIPTTSKSDLRDAPLEAILARGTNWGSLVQRSTSGSDGRPFTVHRTWLEQSILGLFRASVQLRLGLRPTDRLVSIGAMRAAHPADSKRVGRTLHALGLYRRHRLDAFREIPDLAAEILRLRPDVLSGYPGILARIAEHLREADIPWEHPRLLFTGGEVLHPVFRRTIEEGFGAPAFDMYGCHEFNLVAWQCPEGHGLHTCDDAAVVEIVQGEEPVAEGQGGEVVVTGLHSYAMPLIRYRLGDVATRGPTPCPCGEPVGTILQLEGRMFERLVLPGGRSLHAHQLGRLLIADPSISRYQVVQDRPDRVIVRLVPRPTSLPDQAGINEMLRNVLGPEVALEVHLVPELALESSGKFRVYQGLPGREQVRSPA